MRKRKGAAYAWLLLVLIGGLMLATLFQPFLETVLKVLEAIFG